MSNTKIKRQGVNIFNSINNPNIPKRFKKNKGGDEIATIELKDEILVPAKKRMSRKVTNVNTTSKKVTNVNTTSKENPFQSKLEKEEIKISKKIIKRNEQDTTDIHNVSKNIDKNYCKTKYEIVLVTDHDNETVAVCLMRLFKKLGMNNIRIIFKFIDSEYTLKNNNRLYIIIKDIRNNQLTFPNKYIIYHANKEEMNESIRRSKNLLANCLAYWSSFPDAIDKIDVTFQNKIYYLPHPFYKYLENDNGVQMEYDILIYCIKNNRTINVLDNLSLKYNIHVVDDINTKEFCNILAVSKTLLIFHNDENFPVIVKMSNILQYGKPMIFESGVLDDHTTELYSSFVECFDTVGGHDRLDELYVILDHYLSDDCNYNKKKKINDDLHKLQNHSIFSVHKNLVSLGLMKNEMIYDMSPDQIYCLHLTETPFRMREFIKQKYIPDIEIYPAVKAVPGWKGCGLSYQNMIWNARRCNLDMITICEDDCAFKNDFEEKYKIIKEFLKQYNSGWDIFVGCIANLPEATKVKNVVSYKGVTFVELDKMYSMVFNIYNRSCYDTICNWNSNYENVVENSIDCYLKKKNLRIITTYPFEFSCVNVESTLWKGNMFDIYNGMFNASLRRIKEKVDKYHEKV